MNNREEVNKLLAASVDGFGTTENDLEKYRKILDGSKVDLSFCANGQYRDTFYELYAAAFGIMETLKIYRIYDRDMRYVQNKIDSQQDDVANLEDEVKRLKKELAKLAGKK